MHNFKIGELALYTSISLYWENSVVEITSSYLVDEISYNLSTGKPLLRSGYDILTDHGKELFAFNEQLKPLPDNCSWKAIKAEISKPELMHKD